MNSTFRHEFNFCHAFAHSFGNHAHFVFTSGWIISVKSWVGPQTAAGKRNSEVTAFQRLVLYRVYGVYNSCLS